MRARSFRRVYFPVLICVLLMALVNGCSDIFPPDRPENVEATALSQHNIEITWTCEDEESYDYYTGGWSPAVSYLVYMDGKQVADVQDPGWVDDGLAPGTLYCYRVSSYWDEILDWFFIQESGKSREACAWTYPLNTIHGSVTLGAGGLEGVQIHLTRKTGLETVWTTTTEPGGGYLFPDLENSEYLVQPFLAGYAFSPVEYQFRLENQDAYNIDFSASEVP